MINWHSFFFLLFAVIACVFALAMVFSSNIVRMAFYLVISLGAVAGLFLAGADFVGTMQLVIYVGGTLVLLVFGVMLTARGPFVTMKTGGGQWVLVVIAGAALLAVLLEAAISLEAWNTVESEEPSLVATTDNTSSPLGLGLLGVRVDKLDDEKDKTIREGMSGYLLPFEIVSVHLLVILIGAAYLARAKKRKSTTQPTTDD